ncbi:DUF4760 domain-containing protein [Silvibacterium dinghuense]|uniref:Uncharacterized protein n=1 Tax=Silvibacterium dinghuense TaxID=1560006 RepID=A0A4Q1SBF4_9BACT|nr:hypothetical protein [Silvibacterium dinghuense]RXS94461.1 hypothetical protein ESZ00_15440 [Silvibacterium dinghuense]GGH15949.1 hypothetical protein GCM10011586_37430 [Silvibacterium dinghuense]
MFESTLATTQDADLILKLYELRTEATMRQARAWLHGEFFPESSAEALAVLQAFGTEHNAWVRQVTSYWDMAAAFVTHGALNAELFLDCNNEPFFIFAKFEPYLAEIRAGRPGFLVKVQQLVEEYPAARTRVDQLKRTLPQRKAAFLASRAAKGQ